ncbi:hypothetical protein C8R46DRAFT_1051018 [Mycena filopes]|nr:hypothetical protein C8R46DRAFT_1051018 [Mycena filopes]
MSTDYASNFKCARGSIADSPLREALSHNAFVYQDETSRKWRAPRSRYVTQHRAQGGARFRHADSASVHKGGSREEDDGAWSPHTTNESTALFASRHLRLLRAPGSASVATASIPVWCTHYPAERIRERAQGWEGGGTAEEIRKACQKSQMDSHSRLRIDAWRGRVTSHLPLAARVRGVDAQAASPSQLQVQQGVSMEWRRRRLLQLQIKVLQESNERRIRGKSNGRADNGCGAGSSGVEGGGRNDKYLDRARGDRVLWRGPRKIRHVDPGGNKQVMRRAGFHRRRRHGYIKPAHSAHRQAEERECVAKQSHREFQTNRYKCVAFPHRPSATLLRARVQRNALHTVVGGPGSTDINSTQTTVIYANSQLAQCPLRGPLLVTQAALIRLSISHTFNIHLRPLCSQESFRVVALDAFNGLPERVQLSCMQRATVFSRVILRYWASIRISRRGPHPSMTAPTATSRAKAVLLAWVNESQRGRVLPILLGLLYFVSLAVLIDLGFARLAVSLALFRWLLSYALFGRMTRRFAVEYPAERGLDDRGRRRDTVKDGENGTHHSLNPSSSTHFEQEEQPSSSRARMTRGRHASSSQSKDIVLRDPEESQEEEADMDLTLVDADDDAEFVGGDGDDDGEFVTSDDDDPEFVADEDSTTDNDSSANDGDDSDTDLVKPSKTKARAAAGYRHAEKLRKRAKRAAPEYRAKKSAEQLEKVAKMADPVIAVWTAHLVHLVQRFQTTAAATTSGTRLEVLRRVDSAAAAAESVEPLSEGHAVWSMLDSETTRFFVAAAGGLISADVDRAIKHKVLELSPPGDKRPFTGTLFYKRVCRTRPVTTTTECYYNYLKKFPADAAWSILHLLIRGEDCTDIENRLSDALTPVGHGPTVARFFSNLSTSPIFISFVTALKARPLPLRDFILSYDGDSDTVRPHQRWADDMDALANESLPSRLGNFLKANPGCFEWTMYEYRCLYQPQSTGVRTDRVASDTEAFLTRVHASHQLNSAHGGFSRRFQPDAQLVALRGVLSPQPFCHYGSHSLPDLSTLFTSLLRDACAYLKGKGVEHVTDDALDMIIEYSAEGLRGLTTEGHVPFLRLMKAITVEAAENASSATWMASAGPSLQSYRRLHHLIDPTIPLNGDMSSELVARCLGGSIDFWQFIHWHRWFWLHVAWLSRLLMITRPIVLGAWSNMLFTALTRGFLVTVWDQIPSGLRDEFMGGTTTSDFEQHLPPIPSDGWFPLTPDGEFIEAIGKLFILQTGFRKTDLALTIFDPHPGVIYHSPALAPLVEKIIFCVTLIEKVMLEEVVSLQARGHVPSHVDADAAWGYFDTLRGAVEARLATTVRPILNLLLEQLKEASIVLPHLRSIASPKFKGRGVSADDVIPYEAPGFTHASPPHQRAAQYARVIEFARSQERGGSPRDPYHLVPRQFRYDMYGPGFRDWFLARKEGIRISNSSRSYGNTQEASDNATASHVQLSNNKAALSKGGTEGSKTLRRKKALREVPTTKIIACLAALRTPFTLLLKTKKNGNLSMVDSWRYVECSDCSVVVVGKDHNCDHICGTSKVKITESNFPTLTRFIYAQDVFRSTLFGPDLQKDTHVHGYNAIPAQTVVDRPGNRAIVEKILPGIKLDDIAGDIFVPAQYAKVKDDIHGLHLTLAVDCILERESLSTIPHDKSNTRDDAWGTRLAVKTWVGDDVVVVKTDDGLKLRMAKLNDGYRILQPLDLPTPYLRRYWWQHRVFPAAR